MGGLTKALFGGSDQSSSSTSSSQAGNVNNDYIKNALGGQVQMGQNANASAGALLGQGGDTAAADAAFKNYLGSTGYQFQLDQGSKAITGNNASKGLLNSGATLKAQTQYGQNLGSSYFNNYLTQLQGLVGNGNTAASTISGAGTFSNSNSQSNSKGNQQNGIIPGLFG